MKRAVQLIVIILLGMTSGCKQPDPTPTPKGIAKPVNAPSTDIYPPNPLYVRGDDGAAIAAYPDMVKREGDSLLLFVSNKPVARTHIVRDDPKTGGCEVPGVCFDWEFAGVVRLKDSNGVRIALPVIRSYTWGETIYVVIDPMGPTPWLTSPPMASSDGCYLSSGNQPYIEHSGLISVIDWCSGYPRKERVSFAPCRPVQWNSVDAFSLLCRDFEYVTELPALAKRQSDGTWLITPPTVRPDMINREARLIKPLNREWPDRQYGIETLKP